MNFTDFLGSLTSGMGDLFGKDGQLGSMMGGITDMFGNEGFKNLLGGGLGIYNSMQAGDMMDFQKDLMRSNEARSQDVFDREKRDEEARMALDF